MRIYQEKFEKLKQETAAQDINQMVHYFVENEDNNYSLFNYLNVLSDEVKKGDFFENNYFFQLESLIKQKKNLKCEIEEVKKNEQEQRDPKLQKMKQIDVNNLNKLNIYKIIERERNF